MLDSSFCQRTFCFSAEDGVVCALLAVWAKAAARNKTSESSCLNGIISCGQDCSSYESYGAVPQPAWPRDRSVRFVTATILPAGDNSIEATAFARLISRRGFRPDREQCADHAVFG